MDSDCTGGRVVMQFDTASQSNYKVTCICPLSLQTKIMLGEAASNEREARERRVRMPRQARKESGTGIFHVMMRGINHQNIFEV